MKHLAQLAGVAGLLACCASPVLAKKQPQTKPSARPSICAPFAIHQAYLSKRYGERPAFTGGLARGRVLHVFVNPKTGSWTMTIRRANGQSCVVGAGTGWRRDNGV